MVIQATTGSVFGRGAKSGVCRLLCPNPLLPTILLRPFRLSRTSRYAVLHP